MDIKQEAIKLFNEAWDLMDLKERTQEQQALMLHKTHASYYLWSLCGEKVNLARGEWQVSRAYALLHMGQPALLHGQRSLDICLENGIAGFDLPFGHEAVARAYHELGDKQNAQKHITLGREACECITDEHDKAYALSEISSIDSEGE